MFLKRLALTNIRSIERLEMSFETAGNHVRKWTFILGENGTGKSSILRAIALLVAGSEALPELLVRPDSWIRLGCSECVMEAELVTAEGEERHIALRWGRGQHIRTIFEQNKESMDRLDAALRHGNRNYFTIGYGVSRRCVDSRSVNMFREVFANPRAQCVATLFSSDAVLNPLDTWAMDMEYRRSKAGLETVRQALADLLPGVTLSRIDRENRVLLFSTQDGELPLDQLSDGYQNMAAWCGDLLYRITTTYGDYKRPLAVRGLLMIDEIDLHLHPVWQRVFTTHSPLTAQQAGEGELYFLRRASATGPSQLEAYAGAPNKLLTHQLLLSPAFGLPSMNSKEVEDLRGEYRSLQEAGASLSRAQRTRLNQLRDTLSDVPDWTRETELDRRQTALLAKIQETLESSTTGGDGSGGHRKRRA